MSQAKPAAPPIQQQQQNQVDQAFDLKERRLLDHRLRTLHRRHVSDKLIKVVAHWVSVPVGTAHFATSYTNVDVDPKGVETVPPPEETPPAESGVVNVRALLVPGMRDDKQRHPLRRTDIIACNRLTNFRRIQAYGGLCNKGSDGELTAQLCQLIKEQSGMDLSGVPTWHKFLELNYRDAVSTVFFMPELFESPGPLKVVPQATETSEEVEQIIQEEAVDEIATAAAIEAARKKFEEERAAKGQGEMDVDFDESTVEKVMKQIDRTAVVTKVKKNKHLIPLKFALSNLLDFPVQKTTHWDTMELCSAADALDEFIKREMAHRIVGAFQRRKVEAGAKMAEDRVQAEREEGRKRKRKEAEESRKRARKETETKMLAEWEEDDEGKTDEEKRESMLERQGILKALREQYKKEDISIQEEEKKQCESASAPGPQKRLVKDVEQRTLAAFQYFDRFPGHHKMAGTLPRLKIENLLLCVGDFTFHEIAELFDIPQVPKQAQLSYLPLAMSERYVASEEEGDAEKQD